ncbi:thioesterase II family protein [Nocardioides zeae]|uniref:Surfactin synthase thioesterase subunit n=1 Tax=Nocardioides zeae TaxID=1457234 RepID=A0AAJ1TZP0_9ACTN|nr:alpha/beta fold hydrolase [Nocardioides zeae]MDQ1102843.1 surfactin synthase thioesterase subunit [Nocardioides zeae]
MSGTWLSPARENAGARLICFPYAGGSGSAFRQWTRDLAPEIDVLPVRLPGHVGRLREPALSSLSEIVDGSVQAILPLVGRPFSLFGVSMGALVAFETAVALTELGHPPDHLYVASFPSPERASARAVTSSLSDHEFLQLIRSLGATPPGISDDPQMVAMLMPSLRADFDATASHVDSGLRARVNANHRPAR